jgi:hypothetical protein
MGPDDDRDIDPWWGTTPGVGAVRDDPFDDWPTASAIGEVTGPQTHEGLIARAAHGGALPRRRRPAWLVGALLLTLTISFALLGVVMAR